MAQAAAAARAGSAGAPRYARHRPEQTLLYRIVAQHYPAFVELLAGQGRPLPDYVQQGSRLTSSAVASSTGFFACVARPAMRNSGGLAMFVAFFAIYCFTSIDSLSSTDFARYPFGADVPLYTFARGHAFRHPLTAYLLGAYRSLVHGVLGVPRGTTVTKLPFALLGAANVIVAGAVFRTAFDRTRSLVYAACYGLSLMVWYFASVPESYAPSTLLYSLFLLIFLRSADTGDGDALAGTSARQPSGLATMLAAGVLALALLNDASAGVLLLLPLVYYGSRALSAKDVRRFVGAQVAVALAFVGAMALTTSFVETYLGLLRFYTPIQGAAALSSIRYAHGVVEPFLNFFFYGIAAPAGDLTYANTKFPDYVGFFEPSPRLSSKACRRPRSWSLTSR